MDRLFTVDFGFYGSYIAIVQKDFRGEKAIIKACIRYPSQRAEYNIAQIAVRQPLGFGDEKYIRQKSVYKGEPLEYAESIKNAIINAIEEATLQEDTCVLAVLRMQLYNNVWVERELGRVSVGK